MLFTGRKHLSKLYTKSASRHLCKSCEKATITRRSFHSTDPETPQGSKLLEKLLAPKTAFT